MQLILGVCRFLFPKVSTLTEQPLLDIHWLHIPDYFFSNARIPSHTPRDSAAIMQINKKL